jgi:sugar lactone lactonase YvrE
LKQAISHCDLKTGILWRIDPDLSVHAMLHNLQVPNGMGCKHEPCIDRIDLTSNIGSPNKIMYFADSLAQTIYAFDFHASTGNISSQRPCYKFSGAALPDGLTVDETGGIWVAAWRGFAVLHISSAGSCWKRS